MAHVPSATATDDLDLFLDWKPFEAARKAVGEGWPAVAARKLVRRVVQLSIACRTRVDAVLKVLIVQSSVDLLGRLHTKHAELSLTQPSQPSPFDPLHIGLVEVLNPSLRVDGRWRAAATSATRGVAKLALLDGANNRGLLHWEVSLLGLD